MLSQEEIKAKIEEQLKLVKPMKGFVIIQQTMKSKDGKIIRVTESTKDKFDFSFEIVKIGPGCEQDIAVGDHPVFTEWVKFQGLKVVDKDETGMVSLITVHENDIVLIDNNPPGDPVEEVKRIITK